MASRHYTINKEIRRIGIQWLGCIDRMNVELELPSVIVVLNTAISSLKGVMFCEADTCDHPQDGSTMNIALVMFTISQNQSPKDSSKMNQETTQSGSILGASIPP